jgi:hypothetical protein
MVALTAAQIRAQAKAERIAAADEARTAAYQASIPTNVEQPLSQSEFDATVAAGNTAAAEGDKLLAEGDAAAIAAGGKPLNLKPLNTVDKTAAPSGEMQDAYQRLYDEFSAIGLGTLVSDAKDLIMKATSISAVPDALRNTKAYQTRFSANDARIKAGLSALSPAAYLAKEDAYQNLMRNYGLPASYYTPGINGKQEGFDKLLANDVSAVELEDRIATAQQRVLNANPEVLNAIKSFYGDSITNGDILAYTLDPSKALTDIKKKVTAAEIQGAANVYGLNKITAESTPAQIQSMEARANALAGYGVTKAEAEKGFATVAEIAPRGSELAAIYKQPDYTQQTAEAEVFGTAGAADAKKKRQKLASLEQAQFGGQSGVGALGRDRALYGAMQGQQGQY